jgi:hypothetical protein
LNPVGRANPLALRPDASSAAFRGLHYFCLLRGSAWRRADDAVLQTRTDVPVLGALHEQVGYGRAGFFDCCSGRELEYFGPIEGVLEAQRLCLWDRG